MIYATIIWIIGIVVLYVLIRRSHDNWTLEERWDTIGFISFWPVIIVVGIGLWLWDITKPLRKNVDWDKQVKW